MPVNEKGEVVDRFWDDYLSGTTKAQSLLEERLFGRGDTDDGPTKVTKHQQWLWLKRTEALVTVQQLESFERPRVELRLLDVLSRIVRKKTPYFLRKDYVEAQRRQWKREEEARKTLSVK